MGKNEKIYVYVYGERYLCVVTGLLSGSETDPNQMSRIKKKGDCLIFYHCCSVISKVIGWYESNAVVYRSVTEIWIETEEKKKRMIERMLSVFCQKKVFRCVSVNERSTVCVSTFVCRIFGQFWDHKYIIFTWEVCLWHRSGGLCSSPRFLWWVHGLIAYIPCYE